MRTSVYQKYKNKNEKLLWQSYRKNKDVEVRDFFAQQYLRLVEYCANKIYAGLPNNVEFDDLVGYGYTGLIRAIEKFDPIMNVKFLTYAAYVIRGAIWDGFYDMSYASRYYIQKAKQCEETIRILENKMGCSVCHKDVAEEMDLSIKELDVLMSKIATRNTVSINEVSYLNEDDDNMSFIDTLASPENLNPDLILEQSELKSIVAKIIDDLPENEKKVISLRYFSNTPYREISKAMNCTNNNILHIRQKALTELRKKLEKMRFSALNRVYN